jgi:hypothetical protein
MPDWKKLVAENLDGRKIDRFERDDIVWEIAAHLEETYIEIRSHGLSEHEAEKITLQEVGDWHVLANEIHRAKAQEGRMNERTRRIWLPGMITLLGASLSLMVLQRTGYRPNLIWRGPIAVMFYWPWLACLPITGAAGAYLAQRAHAPVKTRLAVAASPALLLLIVMLLILPETMVVDGSPWLRLLYFAIAVANWIVVPGLALLLGALPFLRKNASQSSI